MKSSNILETGSVSFYISILIPLVGFLVVLLPRFIQFQELDWNFIFPLDDAYIYTKFSDNLSKGYFFTFSLGEPRTNGSTSMIWYLLLGAMYSFIPSNYYDSATIAISVIFYLATILLVIKIYKLILVEYEISGKCFTFIVTLGVSTSFLLNQVTYAWFSGLEYPLTVFLLVLAGYSAIYKKYSLLSISTFLLAFSRPEGLFVACSIPAILYLRHRVNKDRSILTAVYATVAAAIAGCVVYLAINYFMTGSFAPSSQARAKTIILKLILHAIIYFGIVYGLFKYLKKIFNWNFSRMNDAEWGILFLFVIASAYLFLPAMVGRSGEWARYLTPVFWIALLVSISLLLRIYNKKKSTWMSLAPITLLFIINLLAAPAWHQKYDSGSSFHHKVLVPTGMELKKIVAKNQTVALATAGIMSVLNTGITIDYYGLGTQRYATKGNLIDRLMNDKPDYIVVWGNHSPQDKRLISTLEAKPYGPNLSFIYKSPEYVLMPRFPTFLKIYKLSWS